MGAYLPALFSIRSLALATEVSSLFAKSVFPRLSEISRNSRTSPISNVFETESRSLGVKVQIKDHRPIYTTNK